MTNEFLAFAPISALVPASPATGLLDEMMARVGVDGIVAALADPGLLALVDQHAAAVRDTLESAGRDGDADGLAGYARAIVAGARRMSRGLPDPGFAPTAPADWKAADWHLLRLVAICMIAEENGVL
ncbi:DUF6401 family natural product biosynthesis protein [Paractinoplanes hotanensis]|uniref:DUF6401 family natural product biosynthesis protein n=1 Tax=Paractinoplanes hotanensis TaxID=2906497 RepID=A0ABT0Y0J7_9ACTN|nr:DUF6401 family natural product biosynthesis protein [Actinoplanes hotanensis]MCM4079546.1 DUF6401 family natural product biosynthesis protein [Actinoplanes hotanensis]